MRKQLLPLAAEFSPSSAVATSDPLLELAEQVARQADALGITAAIIGGIAVAMRGAPRATLDVDLGVATGVDRLRALAERLESVGYHIALRLPDDDDPLGGVIDIRAEEIEDEDGDPVPAGLVHSSYFTSHRAPPPYLDR